MGFLDSFLKRKPKLKPEEVNKPVEPAEQLRQPSEPVPNVQVPVSDLPAQDTKVGSLDLSKKISLNFSKLNLDKKDVRDKTLFLLDVSGSMNDRIDKKRKIESLREVMSKYDDARKVCFSSDVYESHDIPEPYGGTNLAYAFKFIGSEITPKPERIVLVSDGEPDNKSSARLEAKNLSIPVDIIFIGSSSSSGKEFMEQLAILTNGQHFVVS